MKRKNKDTELKILVNFIFQGIMICFYAFCFIIRLGGYIRNPFKKEK